MTNTHHRVLVTPVHIKEFVSARATELEKAGIELIFPTMSRPQLTEEELLRFLPGCSAAIAMPDAYTARVFAACAPVLRLVARTGVGFDAIDLQAATAHNVWVTTTPGANHEAVADYTLGLLLCLMRDLVDTANRTRSGIWRRTQGLELAEKVLGVIGTGRVGRAVVHRARSFGMQVVAYDAYPDYAWATGASVTYLLLPELLARSDIITLHIPASPATENLLNTKTLALCKKGCRIINTARGDLIDEEALLVALNTGHIAGAALDVFWDEPPTNQALIAHPHVLPFSHSAGGTREAHQRAALMALDEVIRVLTGQKPHYSVNHLTD
ncbi:MAG: phosphoglycerate dehydrogenase [Chloroflexi bacterium]|nr:phosphoglycerate dehydrogenase [Chloroflexota bacterium]